MSVECALLGGAVSRLAVGSMRRLHATITGAQTKAEARRVARVAPHWNGDRWSVAVRIAGGHVYRDATAAEIEMHTARPAAVEPQPQHAPGVIVAGPGPARLELVARDGERVA